MDSAAYALGGNAIDQQDVTRLTNALNTLGVTVVLIAHTNREGKDDQAYGSVFWQAGPHGMVWNLKKTTEEGSDVLEVAWHNRKASDYARQHSFAVRFAFDGVFGPITVEQCEIADNPELAGGLSLGKRVLRELRDGRCLTTSELSDELGATPNTIRKTCKRLGSRLVGTGGNGGKEKTWGLADGNGDRQQSLPMQEGE